MNITVECPHCHGTMESREELLGKQVGCPYCMETLKVERSAAPAAIPVPPPPKKERPRNAKPNGELPPVPPSAIHRQEPSPKEPPQPSVPIVAAGRSQEQPTVPAAQEPAGPVGVVLVPPATIAAKKSLLLVLAKSLVRQGNPTDVSVFLSGLVAAAITLFGYAVLIEPIRDTRVWELVDKPGWVAHATCYFTVWAAVVLSIKFWKIGKQRICLSYDLLPVNRAVKIMPGNVDLVENHIRRLPLNQRQSFLINRLLMALENFKARKSVPEVGVVLNSQADTDAAMVDSSYAMLKVLIWAIPMLGFMGTVIGISDAVHGFDGAVNTAKQLDGVKTALREVTQGLATAFDTTLLGLILSMAIMFPTGWIQKAEEDLLSTIDQYCNENLLPRLATAAEALSQEPAVQASSAAAMMQVQVETMQQWQKRLEKLETALVEKVVDSLAEVREEIAKREPLAEKSAT